MRACEIARLQRATEAMEAAYQRLSARLDARGQAKLRAAQQSWLRFRAAEADYQADVATDGTLAPLVCRERAGGFDGSARHWRRHLSVNLITAGVLTNAEE